MSLKRILLRDFVIVRELELDLGAGPAYGHHTAVTSVLRFADRVACRRSFHA